FAASEVVRAHLEMGRTVFMCAPSNGARDVLRADGQKLREERRAINVAKPFERAESLQKPLADKELQQSIGADGLVFVDEAGLASTKMLHELMELPTNIAGGCTCKATTNSTPASRRVTRFGCCSPTLGSNAGECPTFNGKPSRAASAKSRNTSLPVGSQ